MINFYLYSVSSISLFLFYAAALSFVKGIFHYVAAAGAGAEALGAIASGLGYAAVAFPLWWLHWGWLRRQFDSDRSDQQVWHQFYLFTVVCLNVMVMLFAGGVGISSLLGYVLGARAITPEAASRSGLLVSALLLSFVLWRHHWRQFTSRFGKGIPFLDATPNQSTKTPA
jgi:hypothetical protein